MKEIKELKKHKILNRLLIVIEQEDFSEEDVKEAVDLLHKNLFPKRENHIN